jgi:hypothetical protein
MPPSRLAQFAVLQLEIPGGQLRPWAVLLLDVEADTLHIRSEDDYDGQPGETGEVARMFIEELKGRAVQDSGEAILSELEGVLSNAIRITDRHMVYGGDLGAVLDDLFRRYVRVENSHKRS